MFGGFRAEKSQTKAQAPTVPGLPFKNPFIYQRNRNVNLQKDISVSVYLGTTTNKHQTMPQKTNNIRTALMLFPGHLK